DPHAQGLGAAVDAFQLLGDDLAAVARHQLGQGAGVDLVAQRVLDDRRQAVCGRALHAAGGAVERTHVVDVADGDEVHRNVLALGGQVTLRREVDQAEAAVEHASGLDQRPLEVQAGADVGAGDAAEVEDQADLVLADHVDRAHQAEQGGDRQGDPERVFHRLASPRPVRLPSRVPSRRLSGLLSITGSSASPAGAGAAVPDCGWVAPGALPIGTQISWRPSPPMTLRLRASTSWSVSTHRRLRVTSGALWYSSCSSDKRGTSPSAWVILAAL